MSSSIVKEHSSNISKYIEVTPGGRRLYAQRELGYLECYIISLQAIKSLTFTLDCICVKKTIQWVQCAGLNIPTSYPVKIQDPSLKTNLHS